jgi:hypothetical protein
VAITGLFDPAIAEQLRLCRRMGCPPAALLVGDALRAASMPDMRSFWIGDEAHWRDLASLEPAAAVRA